MIKTVGRVALALALLLAVVPQVKAGDYAVQGTFMNVPVASMATAGRTNLNAAIDVTQVSDFALSVFTVSSTAVSGASPFVIKWQTSLDGSNWNATTNDAPGTAQGWFAVPSSTGGGFTNYWTTNITVNSIGYWRINDITNSTGQTLTNIVIRGYIKPKRTNRDY